MNVCSECFENRTLKRRLIEIRPDFPDDERCDLHPTRKAVPLEEVGKIVEPALRANYAIGEWMFDHQEGDDLHTVVNETTGADNDRAINVLIGWLIANDAAPDHARPPSAGETQLQTFRSPLPVPDSGHSFMRAPPLARSQPGYVEVSEGEGVDASEGINVPR